MAKKIGTFKVVFTGFETKEQAQAFASWYEGSGEQQSGDWLECSGANITDAMVHMEKFTGKVNKSNEVIVPLKIYTSLRKASK